MNVAPITVRLAMQVVNALHRREPVIVGALWAVGLFVDGEIEGCAVVGCPKARMLDAPSDAPKVTLEVTRVAVLPTARMGCSMLYGACARAARDMGALRLLTYTHEDEPGTSLRAAGWLREMSGATPRTFGGGEWGRPSRARASRVESGPKHRWWAPWSVADPS